MIRDDDINLYTCVELFKKIHEKFIESKVEHTVAVCMKDLWQNQALFYYLNSAPYLKVELHGWEHKDYSILSYEECFGDLRKSLGYWYENSERMLGSSHKITTFFAPWNRESDNIRRACWDLNLKFCNVQRGEWNDQEIKSFHYWAYIDKELKIDKL